MNVCNSRLTAAKPAGRETSTKNLEDTPMRYVLFTLLLAGAALMWAGGAIAADSGHMSGHMMDKSMPGMSGNHGESEMNLEYMRAMNAMHKPMMDGVTDPDPDTAFVRGMLPHHKGAVDMAEIQLKYGKDPELRKLAQDIIDAQEKEMTFMKDWLKKHGKSQ